MDGRPSVRGTPVLKTVPVHDGTLRRGTRGRGTREIDIRSTGVRVECDLSTEFSFGRGGRSHLHRTSFLSPLSV